MAQSNPANVIKFLHVIENLKVKKSIKLNTLFSLANCFLILLQRTKRTGWLDNGIKQAESISDHMHRMGIMAMLVSDPSINREK